jgi:predicted O-methyltransferase YrrM
MLPLTSHSPRAPFLSASSQYVLTMKITEPLQFCPQLVAIMRAGEVTGRSGAIHKISESSSTLNNLVTLRNLFTDLKPKRTLEVGFAFGVSALMFAASHRDSGRGPSRQHTAIDPFQATVWDEGGLMAVDAAGLGDYLDFRAALSSVALPQLVAEAATFEMIYIDGSHLFEDVFVDFYFATQLLADGGVVAFDDSSNPHVQKVLRFVDANFRSAYEPVDLACCRIDNGASLRYRIAKFLRKTQLTGFRKIGPSTRKWNSLFTHF